MKKPAKRMVFSFGSTEASELESRRLLSADFMAFAPEFAENSKPAMPVEKIAPPQFRFVQIAQFSIKPSNVSMGRPVDFFSLSNDAANGFRGHSPQFASFRQMSFGPDHFQTSLSDSLSPKFGSPLEPGDEASPGFDTLHDPAGAVPAMPSDFNGHTSAAPSGAAYAAAGASMSTSADQADHVQIASQAAGTEILTRFFKVTIDPRGMVMPARMPMPPVMPASVDSTGDTEDDDALTATQPIVIALPHTDGSAPAPARSSEPRTGDRQQAAPAAPAASVGQGDENDTGAQKDQAASFDEGIVDDAREIALRDLSARSMMARQQPRLENPGIEPPPATEANGNDSVWSRLSEAFDLEESDFGPIGEPLDEAVEIDENELSAAVDRILEGFALPVAESIEGPRIGTSIGLAAGTAIAVRIVMNRRKESEYRSATRGRFEDDRTTQIRPDLDGNDATER